MSISLETGPKICAPLNNSFDLGIAIPPVRVHEGHNNRIESWFLR
jgi:hypothetical protein